jgi:putative phosphoesterase
LRVRIALISDLHANLIALDAVLKDAEKRGVDRVVCLGDVATLGPRPSEILARLKSLGCSCILGNHDEFLLDEQLIRQYNDAQIIVDAVDWCRAQLSSTELDFVRGFVRTLEIPLPRGTFYLFHGSPRSHMEDILAETPPAELDQYLDGKTATVMACGHTHIQMLRQHRGILIVNPGSVGMPFRDYAFGGPPVILGHAEYAIVDADENVSVTLCRVELDRAALRNEVKDSPMPLAKSLYQQYS